MMWQEAVSRSRIHEAQRTLSDGRRVRIDAEGYAVTIFPNSFVRESRENEYLGYDDWRPLI